MKPPRDHGAVLFIASLSAAAAGICNPWLAAAEPNQSAAETPAKPQDAKQDDQNNGKDLTRPVNSIELRFRYQQSMGSDSTTERERLYLLATSRIVLDPQWKLSLLAQVQGDNKVTVSDKSPTTQDLGPGDTTFQAILARTLNERWAFGFGARVVAPTAQDSLGPGVWQVMPGFGIRYSLPELGSDSYFVPAMRYDMCAGCSASARNIDRLEIAPTLNIDLPGRWFLTLYPSYDIRINYGDPVSGQTGRLFLPADFAIGREISDHVVVSLEIGVPIVKDYPVYDFKTQLRFILKN
jgi:hypothetical protein